MHGFKTPSLPDELRRQPVQQFGMGRLLALGTEILRGLDQAPAEIVLPETVHSDASSQRILLANKPSGQSQPVWLRPLRVFQGWQHGRDTGSHLDARLEEISADQNVRLAWGILFLQNHGCVL